MKKIQYLIFVLLVFYACNNKVQDDRIIGIWQLAPVMGAGWTESFAFFENGEVIYRINQTICDERRIGYEAQYEYKNDTLYIKKTRDIRIEGGKLVDAKGSCSSDKEIVGGKIVKKETEHSIFKYKVSPIHKNKAFGKLSMKIGDKTYYKHRDNPVDY